MRCAMWMQRRAASGLPSTVHGPRPFAWLPARIAPPAPPSCHHSGRRFENGSFHSGPREHSPPVRTAMSTTPSTPPPGTIKTPKRPIKRSPPPEDVPRGGEGITEEQGPPQTVRRSPRFAPGRTPSAPSLAGGGGATGGAGVGAFPGPRPAGPRQATRPIVSLVQRPARTRPARRRQAPYGSGSAGRDGATRSAEQSVASTARRGTSRRASTGRAGSSRRASARRARQRSEESALSSRPSSGTRSSSGRSVGRSPSRRRARRREYRRTLELVMLAQELMAGRQPSREASPARSVNARTTLREEPIRLPGGREFIRVYHDGTIQLCDDHLAGPRRGDALVRGRSGASDSGRAPAVFSEATSSADGELSSGLNLWWERPRRLGLQLCDDEWYALRLSSAAHVALDPAHPDLLLLRPAAEPRYPSGVRLVRMFGAYEARYSRLQRG